MNKKQLMKKCKRWHDDNLHANIIEAILELSPAERDYDLTCILARAYNNLGKFDEAIELLESVKEEGKNDILWYYRIGFAYGGKYDDEASVEKAIYYLEEAFLTDMVSKDKVTASQMEYMLSNLYINLEERQREEFITNGFLSASEQQEIEKTASQKVQAIKDAGKSIKKKAESKDAQRDASTAKGMAFSIIDEINQEFHKPAISISLQRAKDLSLTQSKVSGLPYIPIGGEIPIGTENRQLSLLAQINCLELPENDLYPKEGILQFWFLDEFGFGIDDDDMTNQDNFRVIYHKEIREHYSEDEVKKILHPYRVDEPLFSDDRQFKMNFKVIESYLDFMSEDFLWEFITRWNNRNELQIEYIDDLEEIDENLPEEIWNTVGTENAKHQIGGLPKFTQEDPRINHKEYTAFETLLFQLDSQFNDEEKEWEFLLGDAGICNFFIEPERLKALDFSRVMFTMDCH